MSYPTHYLGADGRLWRIVDRLPYVLPGEIASLTPGQTAVEFAAETYVHNVEAPFEWHVLFPRAVELAAGAGSAPVADPVPNMNALWRLRMRAQQKGDFTLIRGQVVVDSLVDRTYGYWQVSGPLGDSPLYFERGQGVILAVDSLVAAGGANLRVNISLIGYLVSLQAATEEETEAVAQRGWAGTGRNIGLPDTIGIGANRNGRR